MKMKKQDLGTLLQSKSYPGRGIALGRSANGKYAVAAYFIMGRSVNSRNRVFVEDGEGIRTEAFDPSKMEDPSLIIYAPVRVLGSKTIVSNGDQTDTIYEGLDHQFTFEQSLRSRRYEPDGPNYTPRISGVIHLKDGDFNYALSILKSADGNPDTDHRFTFTYSPAAAGTGHFILRENRFRYPFRMTSTALRIRSGQALMKRIRYLFSSDILMSRQESMRPEL